MKKYSSFLFIAFILIAAIAVADFLSYPRNYLASSSAVFSNQKFFLSAIDRIIISFVKEETFAEEEKEDLSSQNIRALYFTSWSAGNYYRIEDLIRTAENTEINAVVIDIKDYSGKIGYRSSVAEAEKYGASTSKIYNIEALLRKLHENNVYVIGRITVFQDPVLAEARPDLAVHSNSKKPSLADLGINSLWRDRSNLSWLDPSSKEVWDYNIAIAKEATDLGFDEINFDYIRFPSDGNLKDMSFPFWKGERSRREVLKEFFSYLRENLKDVKMSADLFGLASVNYDDLGIGQVIEDAFLYFDFICPMMYPSHYAPGFLGFKNPADHPYEVVNYSVKTALRRLESTEKARASLRPWLQDFNMGAIYTSSEVRSQIKAVKDALKEKYKGYMLWNPSNYYNSL